MPDHEPGAYIAFYSSDIQERAADGLICKRPKGNTYKIQDDAWALDFYYAHKDDSAADLGPRCPDQHPDVGFRT